MTRLFFFWPESIPVTTPTRQRDAHKHEMGLYGDVPLISVAAVLVLYSTRGSGEMIDPRRFHADKSNNTRL